MRSLQRRLALALAGLLGAWGMALGLGTASAFQLSPLPPAERRPESLNELKVVEAQIRAVAAANMMATVVISDGLGSGSGVVVSPDGLVLTAGHVLETGGRDYRVTFPSGRQVPARPLGKNLDVDAGMLQIVEAGPWPFAELGESDRLALGDWCVCLGHPGGYELGRTPPVRAGKVLCIKPTQVITDCALIGGDSGGPLFDLQGQLIGIHSSISYDSIAINRHVTVATFRQHWDRMRRGESWGTLPPLTNEDDEALRPRAGMGVRIDLAADLPVVTLVKPASAAAAAGLLVGDRIVAFDGSGVQTATQLIEICRTKDPGDVVHLKVRRGGESIDVQLELDEINP